MVLCVEKDVNDVPYIQLGKHQLRLDLEDLDEEYKEKARNELNETPEVVESALQQIKEYVSGENRLQVPLDDNEFFYKFLRPHRFNPENSFRVLKNFYKFKVKYPKYGANVTPCGIRNVFDNEVFVLLPTRTSSGSRIMIINAGKKWNPKVVTIQDIFKAVMAAIEIAMMEPKTQVAGVHVIINMEGFGLTHLSQLSPSLAKIIIDWIQECAPTRLQAIHIVNQSFFFNMAYAIFKPFIGEQLRKKIHFHGQDRTNLCDILSKDSLPIPLGGREDMDCPGYLVSEMLYYYEHLFEKHNSYGYIVEKQM